jgi:aspartate carbamoyltransferase regulatory subunit
MTQERIFVVRSLDGSTPIVRKGLNTLKGDSQPKIILQKEDLIEFSVSKPEYALFVIGILSPTSVIKERIGGVEYEVKERAPVWIEGVISCTNKNCITAQPRETARPKFKVVSLIPSKVQCYYCGRYVDQNMLSSDLVGKT